MVLKHFIIVISGTGTRIKFNLGWWVYPVQHFGYIPGSLSHIYNSDLGCCVVMTCGFICVFSGSLYLSHVKSPLV